MTQIGISVSPAPFTPPRYAVQWTLDNQEEIEHAVGHELWRNPQTNALEHSTWNGVDHDTMRIRPRRWVVFSKLGAHDIATTTGLERRYVRNDCGNQ